MPRLRFAILPYSFHSLVVKLLLLTCVEWCRLAAELKFVKLINTFNKRAPNNLICITLSSVYKRFSAGTDEHHIINYLESGESCQ